MAKKVPSKKVAAKKTVAAKSKSVKKAAVPVVKPVVKKLPKEISEKKKSIKRPVKTTDDGEMLALILAQGMAEKKAENIRILDMREMPAASADFYVISHASSDKQVEAIASSAEEELQKTTGEKPWHREGFENLEWVLLDYINVVAHVFQKEKRDFYGVEELWGDAKILPFKAK